MSQSRLYTTKQAAPLLGRQTARAVSDLCRAQLIEHYREETPGGHVTYYLDDAQIAAYKARMRVRALVDLTP